jgi:hypothetical protein
MLNVRLLDAIPFPGTLDRPPVSLIAQSVTGACGRTTHKSRCHEPGDA